MWIILADQKHNLINSLLRYLCVCAQVVCSDQAASYMWGLEVDHEQEGTPVVKLEFTVMYQPQESPDEDPHPHSNPPRLYTSTLDLLDYKVSSVTLSAKVKRLFEIVFFLQATLVYLTKVEESQFHGLVGQ